MIFYGMLCLWCLLLDTVCVRSLKLNNNNFLWSLHVHTGFDYLDPFSKSQESLKHIESYMLHFWMLVSWIFASLHLASNSMHLYYGKFTGTLFCCRCGLQGSERVIEWLITFYTFTNCPWWHTNTQNNEHKRARGLVA